MASILTASFIVSLVSASFSDSVRSKYRFGVVIYVFVGGKLTKPEFERGHNAFPTVRFAAWKAVIGAANDADGANVDIKVIKGGQNAGCAVGVRASFPCM
jgi:hypothetical protein